MSNARVFNIALGSVNGKMKLWGREVGVKRLDTVVKEIGLKLDQHDIIKIDVEGMAFDVLKGAVKTLERSRPKLLIELHPRTSEEGLKNFLKNLRYKVTSPSKYFVIAEFQRI